MTENTQSMPAIILTLACFIAIIISRKERTKETTNGNDFDFFNKKIYTAGHYRA